MIDRSEKEIYRYSNPELLDTIKNEANETEVEKAKLELESRNLTINQKTELEEDYLKFKKFQAERKSKSLTLEEWLSFFILPFLNTKPIWKNDDFTESEIKRFQKFGFEKKYKQAQKLRVFGILF